MKKKSIAGVLLVIAGIYILVASILVLFGQLAFNSLPFIIALLLVGISGFYFFFFPGNEKKNGSNL